MIKYIQAIRPLNLLIIAFSQSFIVFGLIRPVVLSSGLQPRLSMTNNFLFILVTTLIAGAGYLINDYFDISIDEKNQKLKTISNKSSLLKYYLLLVILGLGLSIYIAFEIEQISLTIIYPIAVGLLFLYSRYFKKKGIFGNSIVALFTAFVPGILLVAEPILCSSNIQSVNSTFIVLIVFSIFSFMVNFIREILKDIEDMEGDKLEGSQSIPITMGVEKTKIILYFNITVMIVLVILWTFSFSDLNDFRITLFNLLFIIGPLVLSIFRIKKAYKIVHFHNLSTFYKWLMLTGLISLLLLIKNINSI